MDKLTCEKGDGGVDITHPENGMPEKDLLYRQIINSAQNGIIVHGADMRYQLWNPYMERLTGLSAGEVIGKHPHDLFPFLRETGLIERIERTLAGEDTNSVDFQFPAQKSGLSGWASELCAPLRNSNGDIIGVIVIVTDITERKRTEDALRENELRIRTISNNLYNGMIYQVVRLNDGARKFTYLSDKVRSYYGITPEQGMADANLIYSRVHGDDRERVWLEEERAHETMSVFQTETRMLNPGGEIRWSYFVSCPKKLDDGSTCWDGIEFDISERKKAEEEIRRHQDNLEELVKERTAKLRDSEERFRRLAENIPDIIMRWIPGTGLDYVNPAMEKILEIKPEQILNNWGVFMSHVPPDDAEVIGKAFQEMEMQRKELQTVEYRFVTDSGKVEWLEAIWKPLRDAGGGLLAVEAIARNITGRKNAEIKKQELQEQLIQSQKMEAIGTLAGGLAHDFNNIVATISGTAEMLMRTTPPDAPIVHRLERILNSSRRAKDLTMKLLTFARKEKLNVKATHAKDIVTDVIDMLASTSSKRIRIASEYEDVLKPVNVDSNQIIQALLNISLNACDAMPSGGDLKFKTSRALIDKTTADSKNVRKGEFIQITVSDTGTGIDDENIGSIFEPFFTTKERGKGSGLGLSVSREIIRSHDGFIEMETQTGKGTAFKVFIPVADTDEIEPGVNERKSAGKAAKANVLVIDDDQDFIQMTKEALDIEGFNTYTAIAGGEAVEFYRNRIDDIDIIMLDMILPEMDGTDIFSALKKLNPDVKIVLCSGYSLEGEATELLKRGARAFIQKPFEISEIVDVISGLIHKQSK